MEKAYDVSDLLKKIGSNSIAVVEADAPKILAGVLGWLAGADKSFAALKAQMKTVFPQLLEDEVIAVTKAAIAWFKESAALSPNKIDDGIAALLSLAESEIYAIEGKIAQ